MKRLIALLLLFIGFMVHSLGQTPSPMTVVGDMYIKGSMVTKGAVHVKTANPDSLRGIIDNHGTLKLDAGIILYSNDTIDGLLRNEGTVNTNKVTIRKTFAKSAGYYYTFSFPFNVGLDGGSITNNTWDSNITKPNSNNAVAQLWTDYYAAYYSGERRAKVTGDPNGNWVYLNEDSLTYLTKGEGFRIATVSENVLDFNLTKSVAIDSLFSYSDKPKQLIYWNDPQTRFADNTPSEGWNLLGGLNTTSFLLKNTNIAYSESESEPNLLYFWNNKDAEWEELYYEQEEAVLSPYVTFYLQTNKDRNFIFKKGGLITRKADPIGFRSAEVATKDVLRLTVSKAVNPQLSDRFYVELRDDYDTEFKLGEDGLKMLNEGGSKPQIFSWYQNETTYNLALNRIPSKNQEIKLGLYVPEAGEYIFSLDNIQNRVIEKAILKDQGTEVADLITGSTYKCYVGENNLDRFVLEFSTNIVPIEDIVVKGQDIFAYSNNNILTVKNLQEGDQIKVLDLSGRVVASGIASGDEYSVALAQKGIYLVNVKSDKIVVLKVLNK
ncbi:MAG: T9SS type A sorting domain-containing protein [Dysgonamonadaceae bacterium]|jgi:hypothetical protein|nr:T9SS type A sorting domain-containing protein [Dysgonamonadaceae bacterium]